MSESEEEEAEARVSSPRAAVVKGRRARGWKEEASKGLSFQNCPGNLSAKLDGLLLV